MMDSLFAGEARLLRERVAALEARLDRLATAGVGGTHRMVGRVFSQGAIPTATGKFYACHPVAITGTETEGSTPNKTVDTSQAFFVDLLGGTAAVGDDLVCRRVRHRWVARPGGAAPNYSFIGTLKGCAGGAVGIPTVTITVKDHATGNPLGTVTTDAGGNFSGAVTVSVVDFVTTGIARFNDASTTKTLASGAITNVGNLPLTPATGFHCTLDCAYPLKETLNLHNSQSGADFAMNWNTTFTDWRAGGTTWILGTDGRLVVNICQGVAVAVDIPTKVCFPSAVSLKFILGSTVAPCTPTDNWIVTEL